jgi:dynein heavy chain 1
VQAKLEKRMHRLSPHPNFRLFLTMEIHPKVPVTILRMSNKVVFEPPVGIKSSLKRMFSALPAARVNKVLSRGRSYVHVLRLKLCCICPQAPVERSRLYFLLAWLHAVILERLR